MDDLDFMHEAIAEARLAAADDEVPVGALIVRDGEIIARAHNTRERDKNALRHAAADCRETAARPFPSRRVRP